MELPEVVAEIYERSKRDDAMIVGSEIRQIVGYLRAALTELAAVKQERDEARAKHERDTALINSNGCVAVQMGEMYHEALARAEAAEKERDELRVDHNDWVEREAACCPEDVRFDVLIGALRSEVAATIARAEAAEKLLAERDKLINTPSTANFLSSVELEAAHQVLRWPSKQDAGKSDADWFWLIGYLAGKVLSATNIDKKLHHIITSAAVCLNWHRHITGEITAMRPGIEPPSGPSVKEGDHGR